MAASRKPTMDSRTKVRKIAAAVAIGVAFTVGSIWIAHADNDHDHDRGRSEQRHDGGHHNYRGPAVHYSAQPDYYYAPQPNYYYAPEPDQYYGPEQGYYSQPSQGISLFFGL